MKSHSLALAAMGIKEEKHMVCGPHPPLTSTLWRTFGTSSGKRSEGDEAVHIKTAAVGGYSDILQRNTGRNSPKTWKFNGCKNVKLVSKKGS